MKIAITGGTGFIGRHFIRRFEKNNEIYSLVRGQAIHNHEISIDLSNKEQVFEAINEIQPELVVHLAGIASATYTDISKIYSTNIGITENLLEALYDTRLGSKFLFFSTAGVYGCNNGLSIPETADLNPCSHYAISKAGAEFLTLQYSRFFPCSIIRPFNVIGLGQNPSFIIPKLVNAFKKRESIIELGDISCVRDFVPITTLLNLVESLMREPEPKVTVNACTGTGMSVEEVIQLLIARTNHKPTLLTKNNYLRKFDIPRLVGDPTKMNHILSEHGYYNIESAKECILNLLQE